MDPRYKFIRSKDPFEGLDDYLNSLDIPIAHRSMTYPLQEGMDFGSFGYTSRGLKIKSGYFFERLTRLIYGGKIDNLKEILDGGYNGRTKPDVIDTGKNLARETKSVGPGGFVELQDPQMARYSCIKLGVCDGLDSDPSIRFEFFRHGVRGLEKIMREKDVSGMVGSLAQNTRFLLSLPFQIVFEIWHPENSYKKRGKCETRTPHTRFYSTELNYFLAYPEEAIASYDLDPDSFEIHKFKFPGGVLANEHEIKTFPILLIRDKNPKKFNREFMENYHEKGLNYFEFDLPDLAKQKRNEEENDTPTDSPF